ncbi:MAG: ketopantoate reductase family protein [Chloroflexota bacterium]|nr:ketopantoate reductase family protein [Chloroflexota bacterium]MDE2949758.1 ketopantoate reductase family protein [Chloroflexota bacterium]
MRILIWGAGAIGGTLGAYLIRAGHDILFVDVVEEHVSKINQSGLEITGPVDEFTVEAAASLPQQLEEKYPIILLCTKAQHTEAASETLVKHLADDGYVMSVQNGLNELTIREIVGGDRTLGAFINFSADYHAPGKILFGGRGAVVVGELNGAITTRLEEIGAAFRDFDEDTIITKDLWGYLWGKEAYGAMLFVSALTNEPIADALADPSYRDLYIRAAQEILEVATQIGVEARGFNGFEPAAFVARDTDGINRSLDTLVAFNRVSAKTHSGIWRDLAVRKRRTEVVMYEPILAEGEKIGLDLPLTRRWIEMIREIEDGRRPQTISNLDELKADLP